jgi:hypothetical protein
MIGIGDAGRGGKKKAAGIARRLSSFLLTLVSKPPARP